MNNIILASGSPRRLEILTMAGYNCKVIKPETDENIEYTSAREYVCELSKRKAAEVAEKSDGCIIAADTVVVADGKILGKPIDENDAVNMLRSLSGREHSVLTGFTVRKGDKAFTEVSETKVLMRHITEEEIKAYVDSGNPMDKAGAYGIQCAAGMFIEKIDGDYYTVVGLPICPISVILREQFGITPEIK
ncbi:MAG: septum formation inhibitor Maf [Clostridia bacterium]|nr:septum formation inhibitor Maf [Clostridia bacterium]